MASRNRNKFMETPMHSAEPVGPQRPLDVFQVAGRGLDPAPLRGHPDGVPVGLGIADLRRSEQDQPVIAHADDVTGSGPTSASASLSYDSPFCTPNTHSIPTT